MKGPLNELYISPQFLCKKWVELILYGKDEEIKATIPKVGRQAWEWKIQKNVTRRGKEEPRCSLDSCCLVFHWQILRILQILKTPPMADMRCYDAIQTAGHLAERRASLELEPIAYYSRNPISIKTICSMSETLEQR
jgi:hypothetical protein